MLSKIQAALRVQKSQRNEFGKYNYRSMEDINEAVKPILAQYGLALVISDDLVMLGSRYYIQATASLIKEDGSVLASSTGFAREEETKKGMDASQITGSCSSYARKYAANGLFAIDDTKDADHTNKHGHDEKPKQPVSISKPLVPEITEDQSICVQDWKTRCATASNNDTLEGFRAWFGENQETIHKECGFAGKEIVIDYCKTLTKKAA
jgi:hypothetical protein